MKHMQSLRYLKSCIVYICVCLQQFSSLLALLAHYVCLSITATSCLISTLAQKRQQSVNRATQVLAHVQVHDANKASAHSLKHCPMAQLVVQKSTDTFFEFAVCVIYLFCLLYFCPGGDTCSQNGGEDVTSRQHDWGWRHGPPRTPV